MWWSPGGSGSSPREPEYASIRPHRDPSYRPGAAGRINWSALSLPQPPYLVTVQGDVDNDEVGPVTFRLLWDDMDRCSASLVVRGFFGDRHVVWVALDQTRVGDPHEACVPSQRFDCSG